MSHFIGLCFGEFWEQNLEQYDESLEVEPYIRYTKDEAIDEAKSRHTQDYEYALKALKNKDLDSRSYEYFQQVLNKGLFISYEDAWEEAKKWGYEIDSDENLLSTYNPDSRWDWYSVGGRWGEYLPLKEGEFTNEATVGEIDWDEYFKVNKSPFCFVTEDGEWIEKGEMGWWCAVGNEMDTESWNKVFKD